MTENTAEVSLVPAAGNIQQKKASDNESTPPLKPAANKPIDITIINKETKKQARTFSNPAQKQKATDINQDSQPNQTWPKTVPANKNFSLPKQINKPKVQQNSITITESQTKKSPYFEALAAEKREFFENTLTVEPTKPTISEASMLYETLQHKAQQNPPLVYSIIKKPSVINQAALSNELATIANAKQTVLYLSPALVEQVMQKLGFAQKININEKWNLTLPAGNIQLEFINNTVARISVDTQTLIQNSSFEKQPKALTLSTPPTVVFSLPVAKTNTLTLENNSILAVKPKEVEILLIDFFFTLLKKGQKMEQKTKVVTTKEQTFNKPLNQQPSQQKIPPTMRKILNLPENKPFSPIENYAIPQPEIKSSTHLPGWIQENQRKTMFDAKTKRNYFKSPVIKIPIIPKKISNPLPNSPLFRIPKK
ncbi:hypothetical protein EKK58_04675 [Candidatus Dependentiae bacterium]|nr:MAG: hypothetical protein EKK58_04675 [Candidatus Dependentiae bacterium]